MREHDVDPPTNKTAREVVARSERTGHNRAVRLTGTDLDEWARRRAAEGDLPSLVRRLIRNSVAPSDVLVLDMPTDEGTAKHGPDGIVHVRAGNERVPRGLSLWEMGRGEDYEKKARDDYKKRTKNPPPGIDRLETTFVFVTPRRWPGRAAWQREQREKKEWRDVIVHDADTLLDWLQSALPVWAWFSELLGRPGPLHALESRWREWSLATVPASSEALVLAGRDREQERVQEWLRGPASVLSLVADSPFEADAFCWAALRQLPPDLREGWRQRAIVVSGDDVLRRFALDKQPLLFVAHECRPACARAAQENGHHVLLVSDVPLSHESVTLPPWLDPPRAQVALERMGLAWDHAERLIRGLRGALPGHGVPLGAIRRALGDQRDELDERLAPLLLVGAWTDLVADTQAVSAILGGTPAQLHELTREFSGSVGSPLVRVGACWRWASRRDAWRALSDRLVPADLDRFGDVLLTVFQRPRLFNDQLHLGLLEGLVLLAVDHTEHEHADRIVERLLPQVSLEDWCQYHGALSLLAEAAPEVFAGWVRQRLGDVTVSVPELVRALEVLAWSESQLPVAIDCLARLARSEHIQHGYGVALDAIPLILHPLQPRTSAKQPIRERVFKHLAERHPQIAVSVLFTLLQRAPARDTAVPRHRRFIPAVPPSDPSEQSKEGRALHEHLLHAAALSPVAWPTILQSFRKIWRDHQESTLRALLALDTEELSSELLTEIRRALRELIHGFPVAAPTLDPSWAAKLHALHERLAPADSREAVAWLFETSPTPLGPHAGLRYEAILAQCHEATALLDRELSTAEFLDFSSRVKSPDTLGATLGEHFRMRALELLQANAHQHPLHANEFTRGLIRGLSMNESIQQLWAEPAIAELSESVQVELLAAARAASRDVVALLESKGERFSAAYWQAATYPWIPKDATQREYVVRAFLRVGRAWAAATAASGNYASLPDELLCDVVCASGTLAAAERDIDLLYGVLPLLEYLQTDAARWHDDICQIEWITLPYHGRPPRTLYAKIANDPDYFVEQFRLACSHSPSDALPGGPHAIALLDKWDGLPDLRGDGSLEPAHLMEWVTAVRAAFQSSELLNRVDKYLGSMFARSPIGTDGHWPHEAIREALEGTDSNTAIADAFMSARSPEGKAQFFDAAGDRVEADRLRQAAAEIRWRWMHTASLLERLAREFEENARFWERINLPVVDDADTTERLAALLDDFEAEGRYIIDKEDLAANLGEGVERRRALAESPRLAEIATDTYVIVRPEYRKLGAPPPDWFIDELMRRANVQYCVGLLSAAMMHGAAPQAPQVFQVLVDRPHENVTIGVHRIEFFERSRAQAFTTMAKNTYTGTMLVATAEATVFDLSEFAGPCGGTDAVIEVLEDLGEDVDAGRLVQVAHAYPPTVVELAIELLDQAGHSPLADSLRQLSAPFEAAE